ncbi:hypothetical protein [Nocardia sp. NPDC060259]|uniref:WXG100-like domain-containing protein n=1 Tax=Nocardia sp. NPDC060259 TaxID=3347088 RepID=UPI00366448C7
MSINLPSELHWLGWVAGSDWPDGDEDKMWALGENWQQAADDLRLLLPELRAACTATSDAYPWGAGHDAIDAALGALRQGDQSLERLVDVLEEVASSADATATEIEYTKILVISSLAMLAVEMAAALLFPPTAPLVQSAAIALTNAAVRIIGRRAVTAIASYAARSGIAATVKFLAKHAVVSTVLGAGQDLAIQAGQVAAGHRDEVDLERVGTTALTAAVAGKIGGHLGKGLNKVADALPLPANAITGAAKGAAVGVGAGMGGAVAAWGAGGLIDSNGWTWDPRVLSGGAAFGAGTGGVQGGRAGRRSGGAGAASAPPGFATAAGYPAGASYASGTGGTGSTTGQGPLTNLGSSRGSPANSAGTGGSTSGSGAAAGGGTGSTGTSGSAGGNASGPSSPGGGTPNPGTGAPTPGNSTITTTPHGPGSAASTPTDNDAPGSLIPYTPRYFDPDGADGLPAYEAADPADIPLWERDRTTESENTETPSIPVGPC